jgi:hypothetical protein
MDYGEFQQVVSDAGLSLRQFAILLKLNPTSITNCKRRNSVSSHLAVTALLVRELALHGIDYASVIDRAGITPNAPRGTGRGAFSNISNS